MSTGAETPTERAERLARLKQPPPRLVELEQFAKAALPIIRAVAERRPLNVAAAAELLKRMSER